MKVTLENLTKRFDDVIAVNDLSATFESGKLIALLGPSGCGKSTMLNMLSGILPVTSGRIYFDDVDVTDLTPDKREVGLVFQNYALYPHMTVLQNIAFPLKIKKVPKKERNEKALQFARMVHIEDYLDRRPAELSGGQQQRVAIARALVKNPKLLLLDEPLSNLDAKLRVEMREEIRRIQKASGVTTVFVTHDQEEATSISDYIMLMKLGVKQQFDATRNLYADPANLFVADFIGSPAINQIRGIWHDGGFVADGDQQVIEVAGLKIEEGRRVVLAIRPESLIFNDGKAATAVSVNEIYQAGKDTLINVSLAEQNLRGYIDPYYNPAIGSTVRFDLRDKGVFVFDEATGERIR
ncbi:MAG: ABC transporter ATP-binding protein [Erysipelotrichaceae bacterium]|nr:ABC transporter ATP-binding protein [Erysipelotrichaceae bacterium]MBO4537261.1 ABC transporter ATP-binding protein [Erysipelotrichaceae bacterium]MBR5048661.1 ABC transporter ATP-binding protein [Erysipelotrichaceae bacterium]